jgi:hypothetical protein
MASAGKLDGFGSLGGTVALSVESGRPGGMVIGGHRLRAACGDQGHPCHQ